MQMWMITLPSTFLAAMVSQGALQTDAIVAFMSLW